MMLLMVKVLALTGWMPPLVALPGPSVMPRSAGIVVLPLGRRYPPSSVMASARYELGTTPKAVSRPPARVGPSSPLLTIHLAYRAGAVAVEELSAKLKKVVPVVC